MMEKHRPGCFKQSDGFSIMGADCGIYTVKKNASFVPNRFIVQPSILPLSFCAPRRIWVWLHLISLFPHFSTPRALMRLKGNYVNDERHIQHLVFQG